MRYWNEESGKHYEKLKRIVMGNWVTHLGKTPKKVSTGCPKKMLHSDIVLMAASAAIL